jgi:siroheme synthase-like protein
VGGGKIALRKVIGLLRADAKVVVVSTEFIKKFDRFKNNITMVHRPFDIKDITNDCAVVIAATNSETVNASVFNCAKELNIPCNVVDQPDLCSFIVPAIIRRGDVSIAISTNAASPRFSKYVKKKIGDAVPLEYGEIAAFMAEIRLLLKKRCQDQRRRFAIWEMIFEEDPQEFISRNGFDAYKNEMLRKINGLIGESE